MKTRLLLMGLAAPLLILTGVGCPAKTPADQGSKTIKAPAHDATHSRQQVARELLSTVPAGSSGVLVLDIPGVYRAWDDANRLAGRTPTGRMYQQLLRKEAAKTEVPWPWSMGDLSRLGLDSAGPVLVYGERMPVMVLPVKDARLLMDTLARAIKGPRAGWRKKTIGGRTVHALADLHCHVAQRRMTCAGEKELLAALEQKPKRSVWDDFGPAERADLATATAAFFIKSSPFLGLATAQVEADGLSARIRIVGGPWDKIAAYYKGLRKREILGLAGGAQSLIYFRFDLSPLLGSKDFDMAPLRAIGMDPAQLLRELTGEVMFIERHGEIAAVLGCRDQKVSRLLAALLATVIQKEARKKGGTDGKAFQITPVKGSDGSDYRVRVTSSNPAAPLFFQGRLRTGKAGVLIGTEKLVQALADRQPPTPRSFQKALSTAAAREAFGPRAVAGFHAALSDPVEGLINRYPQMAAGLQKIDPKMRPFLGMARLLMDQLHEVSLGAVRDGQPGMRLVLRVGTLHRHGVAADDEARELWVKGVTAKLAGNAAVYRETLDLLAGKFPGSRYGHLKASRLDGQGTVAATVGILAAVAIPAFIKYIRKSKTVEATEALDKIKGGARQYYVTDHWDSNGNLLSKGFPKGVTTTPTTPTCDKTLTPTSTWDTNGWAPLNFALTEPHYFSYSFKAGSGTGTAATYTARAFGDLDCDTTVSTFELRGSVDGEGSVKVQGPIITSEIE